MKPTVVESVHSRRVSTQCGGLRVLHGWQRSCYHQRPVHVSAVVQLVVCLDSLLYTVTCCIHAVAQCWLYNEPLCKQCGSPWCAGVSVCFVLLVLVRGKIGFGGCTLDPIKSNSITRSIDSHGSTVEASSCWCGLTSNKRCKCIATTAVRAINTAITTIITSTITTAIITSTRISSAITNRHTLTTATSIRRLRTCSCTCTCASCCLTTSRRSASCCASVCS